jgi:hypothetical protein
MYYSGKTFTYKLDWTTVTVGAPSMLAMSTSPASAGGSSSAWAAAGSLATYVGRLTFQLPVVDAPYLGGSTTYTQLSGWRQDSRATQDTFYIQDDPSIREEVLD